MHSTTFNTISLALSMVGLSLCWIPGAWGWIGLALCVGGVAIGVRGMTDRLTPGGGVGMDVAGNFIGGFSLSWGLAFQIKHAAGGLDRLLLPLPLSTVIAIAAGSALIFWVAQIIGRFRARALFVVIAAAAIASATAFGATAWTLADRLHG